MDSFGSELELLGHPAETVQLLERLLERLRDGGTDLGFLEERLLPRALTRLAFAAPFLIRYLTARPARLAGGLLSDLDSSPVSPLLLLPWKDYRPGVGSGEVTEAEAMQRARRWKYDNLLRLTACELLGLHPTAVACRLLSDLAEGFIEELYRYAFAELVSRRGLPIRPDGGPGLGAVVGMGKLGGRELNYSSDVDILFIHDAEGARCHRIEGAGIPAGGLEREDYWRGWRDTARGIAEEEQPQTQSEAYGGEEFHNQLARMVTRLVGAKTIDGLGFRVDTDLRPQGRSGLLSSSLGFLSQYYDIQGREWERTALLKARLVAGCPRLYEDFEEIIQPFVYRRYLDYGAVEGIALVKHDIDRKHRGVGSADIKLGRGGIRENEFLVQALQLLYGGKNPELRVTSHAGAIAALAAAGILPAGEAEAHLADYWLMRKCENRLQMVEEAQTHRMPEAEEARLRILHDFNPGFPGRLAMAEKELELARGRTSGRFRELFAGMEEQNFPEPSVWRGLVEEFLPEEEQVGALSRIDGMLSRLMRSREGERCVFKLGRLLSRREIHHRGSEAAFPRWLDFFDQIGNRNTIFTLLSANPGILSFVSTFLAEAGLHSRQLIRHPEYLESFLLNPTGQRAGQGELFRQLPAAAHGEEEFILELQMAKSQAFIQIVAAYLSAPRGAAHRAMLSDLAGATVEACTRYAWRLVTEKQGLPAGVERPEAVSGFAVMAMGRLGSRRMHFGSDIDLVFVHGGEGATSKGRSHYEFYTRLAQKIAGLLTAPTQFGKLYEIDHRLRPFGGKGALAPSLASFTGFLEQAEVWNFQAFTRIRHLCGDGELSASLIAAVAESWRAKALPPPVVARQVRDMLGRLVAEHGPDEGAAARRLPLKYAVGGMIGYDFLGQLHFLLTQGAGAPPEWTQGTEHETIIALRPSHDLISGLDERLSFYEPAATHEVTREAISRLTRLEPLWNWDSIKAAREEMESLIERAFADLAS